MTTVTLEGCWIFAGKRYGPGEADLPEDAHKALGAKGAFTPEVAATAAEKPADDAQDTDPVVEAVGAEIAASLSAAGFDSLAAIQAANDDDLLAINGIGKARLEALRALKGQE